MRRVLVIGPCGAGKSSLSRRLGPILGLLVVHLDAHYWREGWAESPEEEWQVAVRPLVEAESWIIDGTFITTLPLRLEAADTVVFLDLQRRIYMWRILRRIVSTYGRVRPDLAPGCPERLDLSFLRFAWRFERDYMPRIERALQEVKNPQLTVHRLRTPAEVERFVRDLQKPPAS